MVLMPSTPGRFSFTADTAKAAYEAKFARDPATYAWLAENSIDHYEKLIKMADDHNFWLDHKTTLSEADQLKARIAPRLTTGAQTDNKYLEIIHAFKMFDEQFLEPLTAEEILVVEEDELPMLHCEARRYNVDIWGIESDIVELQKAIYAKNKWEWKEPPEEYFVKRVLDKKEEDGVTFYYVLWDEGDKTWEPVEHLKNIKDMLKEFDEGRATPKPKRRRIAAAPKVPAGGSMGGGTPDTLEELDPRVEAMLGAVTNLSTTVSKLAERDLLTSPSTEKKETLDTRLPGHRPMLKGDVRKKEIGDEYFRRERKLRRGQEFVKMDASKPFAFEYNGVLKRLLANEQMCLECDMKVTTLAAAGKGAADADVAHWLARKKLIEEDYIMLDDRREFLRKNSELASRGESSYMLALMLEELQDQDQTDTAEDAEWRKLKKRGEAELKERSQRDQALLVAKKLGVAATGYETTRQYQAQAHLYAGGAMQWHGVAPPQLPAGAPPLDQQLAQAVPGQVPQQWVQQQQLQQQQAAAAAAAAAKNGGKQRVGAAAQGQALFEKADTLLGARCPPALRGKMIPAKAHFGAPGKSLDDKKKDRGTDPFPYACKQCGVVGHEAFECESSFQINGVPALSSRQLYKMVPPVVDKTGKFII